MIKRNLPLMITIGVFVLGYLYCLTQFPGFASTRVICNILTDNAFLGIIAVGMTFVILTAAGVSAGAGDGLCLRRIYGAFDRRPEDPGIYHYPGGDVFFCAASATSFRKSRFR